MKLSSKLFLSLFLLSAALISGCASVPIASMDEDAKAKTFATADGKSNIYVYRDESFGGAIPMTVALDGKVAGQTGPKTYFLFVVDPGPHEVSSLAENNSILKLNAEAGKSYFIWQEVKMGILYARTKLNLVDEEEGKEGVLETTLAATK